jgi:hypothetical protein
MAKKISLVVLTHIAVRHEQTHLTFKWVVAVRAAGMPPIPTPVSTEPATTLLPRGCSVGNIYAKKCSRGSTDHQ